MPDYLEFTVDKFTFKVATDRRYNIEGVWVKKETEHVKLGISDYLHQRSGDVAFVEVKPEGTQLHVGDEFASLETIKVNISLSSPVSGRLVQVNPVLSTAPEMIDQDPYGEGWLATVELQGGDDEIDRLLEPRDYFNKIKLEAEQEAR
jgi:glycine cleavage system H protein